MNQPVSSSIRQLLEWIDAHPRTYSEVMDAWRSTCPRLTVWEDALDAGYVQIENEATDMRAANVTLTPTGKDVVRNHSG